jgi:hypothetical protein
MFCEDSLMFSVQWNIKYSASCLSMFLSRPVYNCTSDVSRVSRDNLVREVMCQVNGFNSLQGHRLVSLQTLPYWLWISSILLSQR